MKKDIIEHLLQDEVLAGALNEVCTDGTKEITDGEGGSITVPDYHLRLKGVEIELKLKGHFREKRQKSDLIDGIYTLKK